MVGAEHGDPGGVTVCRGVEQRAQNGGGAGGDHGDGRPPWDVTSGKKLLLRAVNSVGWSVKGVYEGEQSCWGSRGASKDTILSWTAAIIIEAPAAI